MTSQASSLNQDDRKAEALQLLEQGDKQSNAFELEGALQLYQKALDIYQELGESNSIADTLIKIAAVQFRDGDIYLFRADKSRQIALEYYQKALDIYTEIGDRAGVGVAFNNLGLVYFRRNQSEQALELLQQALGIRREIDDKVGEGSSLHNIGWVYENLAQFEQALDYYQQALAIRRAIDDKVGISDTLRNIGAIYQNLQQIDKARDFYLQAIEVYKELAAFNRVATLICNTGMFDLLSSDDPFHPGGCPVSGGNQVSGSVGVDPPPRKKT